MKILYAIQATGNGHISRAMEILPYLKAYGEIDILLSGTNSTLPLNAPVTFRSKGLSLHYTCSGNLNYFKTFSNASIQSIIKDARDLPVEKYDLVLNDFDAVCSLACKKKKVPSIHFGHQASFISDQTPRPVKKNKIGEWVLKNYAKGTLNIGLHFESYADFIEPPVIKGDIWNAFITNKGHITVYLPSYCDKELIEIFSKFKNCKFEIFSRQTRQKTKLDNITLIPVDKTLFNNSLISCEGIITGAGFETPAEALYLKKKLLAIPIGGQYEQICNAAALEGLGVKTLPKIQDDFSDQFTSWLTQEKKYKSIDFKPTKEVVDQMMQNTILSKSLIYEE